MLYTGIPCIGSSNLPLSAPEEPAASLLAAVSFCEVDSPEASLARTFS